MSRLSPLPERLRYLQPFRKKFASRPPEELNEDTGGDALLALLHKRIDGLTQTQAEELLKEDGAALQSWLATLEHQNDPLHFASAFMTMVEASDLVGAIKVYANALTEPQYVVEMDLPADAKLRRDKLITFKGLLIGLGSLPAEVVTNMADALRQNAGSAQVQIQIEEASVCFGSVIGTKFITKTATSWGKRFKTVDYILATPGGHVHLGASFFPKKGSKVDESEWDEKELEASLHSLRVVRKPST